MAKFLNADQRDLSKLQFIKRLIDLARNLGRGRSVARDDIEDALRLIELQSPHRKWNRQRRSEARLCLKSYLDYEEVIGHLENGGVAYTWHDVITGFRQFRRGDTPTKLARSETNQLRTDLLRFGRSRGLSIQSIERCRDRVTVIFTSKRRSKKPPNKSLEHSRGR